ncbi:MAG: tyrosine-type recombinase/integrase [Pseudolabrys sp.]|jgi:integrase
MARTVREASLATRSARLRLAVNSKPYWRVIEQGLHLGYRRRATGGSWIARRRNDGGQYRESKLSLADDLEEANGDSILDFSQAQRAARNWHNDEQRLAHGYGPLPKGPYTVAQAMADYFEDYRRRGGKSIDAMESVVKRNLLPILGKLPVPKLTPQQLRDWHRDIAERAAYRRSRKDAPVRFAPFDPEDPEQVRQRRASANRVLSYLKAALNLAWRNGLVPSDDAWRRVKPYRSVEAPLIRYLSNDEITRLMNASTGGFRNLVYLALLTGCRYGELCRFVVADYNPDVGSLTVRIAKGGKVRHVTLTAEADSFVASLVAGRSAGEPLLLRDEGRAWRQAEQVRPMREACARAGIVPNVGFHVLRHTHGSLLAMKAVPMAVIARQLGHADTRMTEKHYAHLAPNYVADTIRGSFPQLGFNDRVLVSVSARRKKQLSIRLIN